MYPAGNLFIPAPHGRLEAILKEPRGAARGVALVLHPHPLHGGTMHNKVVFRAARALNDAGLVTLRVNFRGVGHSTGAHDHARGGEQEDARAALEHLAGAYPAPRLPRRLLLRRARRPEVGTGRARQSPRRRRHAGRHEERDYDFSFLRECRSPPARPRRARRVRRGRRRARPRRRDSPRGARRVESSRRGHFFEGNSRVEPHHPRWAEANWRASPARRAS